MQIQKIQIDLPWGGEIKIERKPREKDELRFVWPLLFAFMFVLYKIIMTAIS